MRPAWVAATQVRTTAKAGAPQGAATTPEAAPMTKTAAYEPPSSPPAHAMSFRGTGTGITSSMARAKRRSRLPMPMRAQGLALTEPKRDPVRPASAPRKAYSVAIPTA